MEQIRAEGGRIHIMECSLSRYQGPAAPAQRAGTPQGPLELNPISAQTLCRLFYQAGSPLRAHPAPRFLSDWSAGLQHKPGLVYLSVITASRLFTSELSQVDLIYMCTGSPGSWGGDTACSVRPPTGSVLLFPGSTKTGVIYMTG